MRHINIFVAIKTPIAFKKYFIGMTRILIAVKAFEVFQSRSFTLNSAIQAQLNSKCQYMQLRRVRKQNEKTLGFYER